MEMGASESRGFLSSLAIDGRSRHVCSKPGTIPFGSLLGHCDLTTTQIYTHRLNREPGGMRNPVDDMVDQ